MDTDIGQDIHATLQEFFKLLLEPDEIEERPVVFHLDQ
jgi:hypothetical protein